MATRRPKGKAKSGGLGRVAQAANRKGDRQWIKMSDGDVLYVRVLDTGDDWKDAYCHRVPMEKEDGSTYHSDVPCLDQDEKGLPCPGCKDDLPRRYKFWTNAIVRDHDDGSGKEKDTLMIWSGGITIAKRLDKMEARYGLLNRDLEVERRGATKNDTRYEIEPATDENEPLSSEDKKLMERRHDLTRYSKAPAFEDFYKSPKERGDEDDEETGKASINRNAFAARKRKKRADDDDDDEPAPRTRRRSSRMKDDDDDDEPVKTSVRRRRR